MNLQREKAWTLQLSGHFDAAGELLQQTLDEYIELSKTGATIDSHPQYRLAILCQEIFQDLEAGTPGPSERTLSEVDKVASFIGRNSPLLTSKLAIYKTASTLDIAP